MVDKNLRFVTRGVGSGWGVLRRGRRVGMGRLWVLEEGLRIIFCLGLDFERRCLDIGHVLFAGIQLFYPRFLVPREIETHM